LQLNYDAYVLTGNPGKRVSGAGRAERDKSTRRARGWQHWIPFGKHGVVSPCRQRLTDAMTWILGEQPTHGTVKLFLVVSIGERLGGSWPGRSGLRGHVGRSVREAATAGRSACVRCRGWLLTATSSCRFEFRPVGVRGAGTPTTPYGAGTHGVGPLFPDVARRSAAPIYLLRHLRRVRRLGHARQAGSPVVVRRRLDRRRPTGAIFRSRRRVVPAQSGRLPVGWRRPSRAGCLALAEL